MNWQHFQAFIWLRWRLFLNQMRKGGTTNAVLLTILVIGALFGAVSLFCTFFVVGLLVPPQVPAEKLPQVLMYIWDGLVVAFLFSWSLGLLVELQRAEVLSLEKFLHLPVSLTSAFLINYLSSLLNLSTIVFLPAMAAFSVALVISQGPKMLPLLPLLAAFLLMVTALTYQFQGWLAALMVNKRRRRTVIVVVTMAFVLVCQVPNLINILPHNGDQETAQIVERVVGIMNVVLPPGWLPLGAKASVESNFVPPLLGIVGMTMLGGASLWRSYRTTVRLYTGQFSSGKKVPLVVAPTSSAPGAAKPAALLIEKELPWLSGQAAAVALGGFRSLTRAPEAKMMLLTPIILVVIFGSMFMTRHVDLPEMVRPLLAFGALTMILMTMSQLVGNQFGFDRGGFRVFVLSAAPRRDILLGKNLAVAPLALGLGGFLVGLVEVVQPMRIDHLLAILPQSIAMFLLFCLLANCMSILAPMPIRLGSFKPANPKAVPILLQIVFAMLSPWTLVFTMLPLGIEFVVTELTSIHGLPICLLLSLLECVLVVFLYRYVLGWQGKLLHARELRILEIVTSRIE